MFLLCACLARRLKIEGEHLLRDGCADVWQRLFFVKARLTQALGLFIGNRHATGLQLFDAGGGKAEVLQLQLIDAHGSHGFGNLTKGQVLRYLAHSDQPMEPSAGTRLGGVEVGVALGTLCTAGATGSSL